MTIAVPNIQIGSRSWDKPMILPYPGCKPLLGVNETVITREDMHSAGAWVRLAKYKSMHMKEKDFVDPLMYYKYFLLSFGLLEYPVALMCGLRGDGKSMGASFLSYLMHVLFGKSITMEKPPPKPELFGKINYLHAQDYIDKMILDLALLDKIENDTGCPPSEEILKQCILYNAWMWHDESQTWADRSRTYNLVVLIYRVITVARHLHLGMLFNYIQLERAHPLISGMATHIIRCKRNQFSWLRPGTCSMEIQDIRPGGTGESKFIHLYPPDWADMGLWNTNNIPSIVKDVEIYLGGNKKPKKTPTLDLQAAADRIRNKEIRIDNGIKEL